MSETYPIPLNDEQERAAKQWAADDRLWTTQETVEFNLRVFARVILASREEENRLLRDQVGRLQEAPAGHERDCADWKVEQVGRLRELVKQWRDEAKHNDREAFKAQRRTALYHGPPNVEYHTAVNRRRVYTKCADGLDALLSGTQEQPK